MLRRPMFVTHWPASTHLPLRTPTVIGRRSSTTSPTAALARDFWSMNLFEVPQGSGSGFVWDRQGDIVTNYHVIAQASKVKVVTSDGKEYQASVAGADLDHDMAVLRIKAPAESLPPLSLGSSANLRVGQMGRFHGLVTQTECEREALVAHVDHIGDHPGNWVANPDQRTIAGFVFDRHRGCTNLAIGRLNFQFERRRWGFTPVNTRNLTLYMGSVIQIKRTGTRDVPGRTSGSGVPRPRTPGFFLACAVCLSP